MQDEAIKALARKVAARAGVKLGKGRHLRAVGDDIQPPGMTALQRDVLYRRIRDLGNMYWLNWLIRQETAHVLGVMECLKDAELQALLENMEIGRECREEGIAFHERGLVKSLGVNLEWP
jgi:hypothetical protein